MHQIAIDTAAGTARVIDVPEEGDFRLYDLIEVTETLDPREFESKDDAELAASAERDAVFISLGDGSASVIGHGGRYKVVFMGRETETGRVPEFVNKRGCDAWVDEVQRFCREQVGSSQTQDTQ